jgi:hypothetical protein
MPHEPGHVTYPAGVPLGPEGLPLPPTLPEAFVPEGGPPPTLQTGWGPFAPLDPSMVPTTLAGKLAEQETLFLRPLKGKGGGFAKILSERWPVEGFEPEKRKPGEKPDYSVSQAYWGSTPEEFAQLFGGKAQADPRQAGLLGAGPPLPPQPPAFQDPGPLGLGTGVTPAEPFDMFKPQEFEYDFEYDRMFGRDPRIDAALKAIKPGDPFDYDPFGIEGSDKFAQRFRDDKRLRGRLKLNPAEMERLARAGAAGMLTPQDFFEVGRAIEAINEARDDLLVAVEEGQSLAAAEKKPAEIKFGVYKGKTFDEAMQEYSIDRARYLDLVGRSNYLAEELDKAERANKAVLDARAEQAAGAQITQALGGSPYDFANIPTDARGAFLSNAFKLANAEAVRQAQRAGVPLSVIQQGLLARAAEFFTLHTGVPVTPEALGAIAEIPTGVIDFIEGLKPKEINNARSDSALPTPGITFR